VSLQTRLSDLITAVGTDIKQLRTFITGSASGNLTGLTTTNKNSLVEAINEVQAGSSGAPPQATTTVSGIIEIATLAEVANGTDTDRAVTPEGVRQERLALKTEILGGAGAAYDTLKELQDAITADDTAISGINTALANRVRTDTAAQGLDATQQGNARTNISVYSKAELGDPETDLVAAYVAAKT
jgi:hypothetical protein